MILDFSMRVDEQGLATFFQQRSTRMSFSRLKFSLLLMGLIVPGAMLLSTPLNGAIKLTVDATQAPDKIIRTREVIPVKAGPLTLYYPKWIPGEHEPSGPVGNVAGLKFTANGKTIPWRRDLLDVFTLHVDVPAGADSLEATFEYLEPTGGPYSGGASATDKLVIISWNQDVLYPAGVPPTISLLIRRCGCPKGGNTERRFRSRTRRGTKSPSSRWSWTAWWIPP